VVYDNNPVSRKLLCISATSTAVERVNPVNTGDIVREMLMHLCCSVDLVDWCIALA